MLQVIAFDFGNVIGRFDHRRGCRQIAALTADRYSPDDIYRFLYESRRFEAIENGSRDAAEFLQEIAAAHSIADLEALEMAYCDIFSRDEATCRIVRQIAIPKLLASNTDAIHWRMISKMFAAELGGFEPGGLLRSNELRCRKPAAAFFKVVIATARAATRNPDLPAHDVLFVDDMEANCAGAADAGLLVHLHSSANSLRNALLQHGITLDGNDHAAHTRCA